MAFLGEWVILGQRVYEMVQCSLYPQYCRMLSVSLETKESRWIYYFGCSYLRSMTGLAKVSYSLLNGSW